MPPTPPPTAVAVNEIDFWLTKGDQSIKLEKQTSILKFANTFNSYANIEVFDAQTFQTVEGFGYSLTNTLGPLGKALNAFLNWIDKDHSFNSIMYDVRRWVRNKGE